MKFIPLAKETEIYNGYKKSFKIKDINLLLIQENNQIYIIENKCGHFGVALDDGAIKKEKDNLVIVCKQHGISFDLNNGNVVNRPWENCDAIKIYDVMVESGVVGYCA